MQAAKMIGGVAMVLATLAACGGDADRDAQSASGDAAVIVPTNASPGSASVTGLTPDTSAAAAATAIPPAPPTVPQAALVLNALNNSGITGEVATVDRGGNTDVTLKLTGAPSSAKLAAHVHTGRCASGGPVAAPLDPITTGADQTGSSTTVVNVPMATLMDGNHYVQAHEPGGSPGKPVACADLPKMPG